MSRDSSSSAAPIGLRRDEGEAIWFLDFLALIKASAETTDGGIAVVEHYAAKGAGSPLHVHHRESESFYVTDGALTVWAGGRSIEATAGSFVYAPRDVPHTFTVTSAEARFLLLTQPAGFEGFMRAFSQPAQTLTLPPPSGRPPDLERLTALAAEYGIEILGPPGVPT